MAAEGRSLRPEQRVAEVVREQGYIDIRRADDLSEWVEDVVLPVIAAMRDQGWTVTPPEPDDASGEGVMDEAETVRWRYDRSRGLIRDDNTPAGGPPSGAST